MKNNSSHPNPQYADPTDFKDQLVIFFILLFLLVGAYFASAQQPKAKDKGRRDGQELKGPAIFSNTKGIDEIRSGPHIHSIDPKATGAMKINVLDETTRETIPFANVMLEQNEHQVKLGQSNIDGEVMFTSLSPGEYKLKISYVGYEHREVSSLIVAAGQTKIVNAPIKNTGIELGCFVLECFSVPLIDTSIISCRFAVTEDAHCRRGCGWEYNCIDGFYNVNTTTSTSETETKVTSLKVLAYPNPSSGFINIEASMNNRSPILVTISDATGKEIYTEQSELGKTGVDLSNYSSGIYFVRVRAGDIERTERVVLR